MKRLSLLAATAALAILTGSAHAGDLVRVVRAKLSAGDLASGIAAAEDYKRATGVDEEYLNAVGWLARGAEMLKRPELAGLYVDELHREIPEEREEYLTPYGAAIEVEGRLIAACDGRGAAIRFLEGELGDAKATSLRSRISKNLNMLSLESRPAPPVAIADVIGKL
ncbi:MAG: hypothetical protein NDJ92_05285, partial [Thermoanaerobaculia bacterium]|nr:hypothetical protein [Thermoanaerobaculia bacterium]